MLEPPTVPPPPHKDKSTFSSTTPSLGLEGDGWTKSALTLHNISVVEPGKCIRDEPLDNINDGDDTLCCCCVDDELLLV